MNEIKEKINVDGASCRPMSINELMSVLRYPIQWFWSWAPRQYMTNDNKTMFRMRVSGHHHKGHVYIFLNWSDLFDVYFTTLQGVIKDKGENIYVDTLSAYIDSKVERIKEYMT